MEQVLQGIAQCHSKSILVRDVKPENFLFLDSREDAPLKMIDFGLATHCTSGQQLKDRAGTPGYVAPEVLKQLYGLPSDIWSAGDCRCASSFASSTCIDWPSYFSDYVCGHNITMPLRAIAMLFVPYLHVADLHAGLDDTDRRMHAIVWPHECDWAATTGSTYCSKP